MTIRNFLIVLVILLWAAAVCTFAYKFYPREMTTTVTRYVAEMQTRERTVTIVVDGKPATAIIPTESTVMKPVPEQRVSPPTADQWLRFVFLCAIGGVLLLALLLLIIQYFLHTMPGKTVTKSVEMQFALAMSFCTGALGGVLAAPPIVLSGSEAQAESAAPSVRDVPSATLRPTPTPTTVPTPPLPQSFAPVPSDSLEPFAPKSLPTKQETAPQQDIPPFADGPPSELRVEDLFEQPSEPVTSPPAPQPAPTLAPRPATDDGE